MLSQKLNYSYSSDTVTSCNLIIAWASSTPPCEQVMPDSKCINCKGRGPLNKQRPRQGRRAIRALSVTRWRSPAQDRACIYCHGQRQPSPSNVQILPPYDEPLLAILPRPRRAVSEAPRRERCRQRVPKTNYNNEILRAEIGQNVKFLDARELYTSKESLCGGLIETLRDR